MDKIIESIKKKSRQQCPSKGAIKLPAHSRVLLANKHLRNIPAITITSRTATIEKEDSLVGVPPLNHNGAALVESGGESRVMDTLVDNSMANVQAPAPKPTEMIPSGNASAATSRTVENTGAQTKNGTLVRHASTGTLNRLILVAQALETEVDSRQRNDVNGLKLVCTIRMANMILLLLSDTLIFTGLGHYHARNSSRLSLLLTADKWYYRRGAANIPPTFVEMRLPGQFFAASLTTLMLIGAFILQMAAGCRRKWRLGRSKLLSISYSFLCVPLSLVVFGLEMHYSSCPWLDDYYRAEIARRDFRAVERHIDTQCSINGWALAGIFSLLSCGLFVSEGLITAFFRTSHHLVDESDGEKTETLI